MSILSDLSTVLEPLGIPFETGRFKNIAADKYIVIVPLVDTFELHADNLPSYDIQEARLSLFSKGNYTKDKNKIVRALLAADITITDRKYIGYENDTGYFHYCIDVAKEYETEEF